MQYSTTVQWQIKLRVQSHTYRGEMLALLLPDQQSAVLVFAG